MQTPDILRGTRVPFNLLRLPNLRQVHPRLVDDADIVKAVEEAAQAAVAVLDILFP